MRCTLVFLLLLVTPASASAINVSGRLTASAHSWERQETDSTSTAITTIHQLVSFTARDLGVKGLSFHFYGRGFVRAEGSEATRRLALYNTYADWRGIAGRLDLRLGRQRVFAGVGRAAFDGVRAEITLPRSIRFLAYAGTAVPRDYSTRLMGWDEARAYGVRLTARKWKSTFSVSFAGESRERTESLAGPDSARVRLSALARRAVGAEVKTRYFAAAQAYGRVEVDARDWSPARVQARIWGNVSPGLRLSGELDHRRPSLPANSYLSVFSSRRNTELEATMAYTMRRGLLLSGAYAVIYYDDDETQRFRASLSRGGSTITYYRRLGYGGDRDGLSVTGRRSVTENVSLRGSVNVSTYRLSDYQDDRDDTLAGVLGVDYANTGKLAATVETQILRNKTYDYDLRLFGKLTWWFSLRR